MRKVLSIIDRVRKKKAVGIIYNIPKNDQAVLQNKLLDQKHIIINGSDAYTSVMLLYRLQKILKVKRLQLSMIPGLINLPDGKAGGKIIVLTSADGIRSSYSKVLDDFNKYKIPLLILMNSDAPMKDFRKLGAYQRVLTIEQDYSTI